MKRVIMSMGIGVFLFFMFIPDGYALKLEANIPRELDEEVLEELDRVMAAEKNEEIVRPKVEYKAQGLRNPFEQPSLGLELEPDQAEKGLKEVVLPLLIVQGIIWEGNPKQAIINNNVVKVGDTLESVDIVDISKEGVIVLFAGVEYGLSTTPAMVQHAVTGK
jgi:hypothetical protein